MNYRDDTEHLARVQALRETGAPPRWNRELTQVAAERDVGHDGADERVEVSRLGYERLSRARRCVEDDVGALEDLENGFFLSRIEIEPARPDVSEERAQDRVARRVAVR